MLKSILKNTGYLIFSKGLSKLLFLFLVIFISRILGVEGLGIYSFTIALGFFIFLFVDMVDGVVVRELVSDNKKIGEYIWNFFYLKMSFASIAFVLLVIWANVYPMSEEISPTIQYQDLILIIKTKLEHYL